MQARAKLLGHPIHQMLIPFPLGLLTTSIIFDLIHLFTHHGRWAEVAFYLIVVGVISGLVAAVFGLIDWMAIPWNTRAKNIGMWHGGGNVVMVLLFIVSGLLRWGDPATPSILALILSFVAVGLSAITGWLGGELVDRLGVGVDDGANLNAVSSLSHPRDTGRSGTPRTM